MTNDIKKFVTAVLPVPASQSPPQYMNLHYTVKVPNIPKDVWNGSPTTTALEFENQLNWIVANRSPRGVWFCTSTQSTRTERTGKTGKKFYVAERTQAGFVLRNNFCVDLDLKDNYPDQVTALQAFENARAMACLPKPKIMVDTGGGVHIYWVFEQPMTLAEWQPRADGLRNALVKEGLKFDTGCTTDAVRLMRVPGTLNHKYDPPRAVNVIYHDEFHNSLQNFDSAILPYLHLTPKGTAQAVGIGLGAKPAYLNKTSVSDEFHAGIGNDFPTPTIDRVAEECAWISDMLADGGKGVSQPLWSLAMLTAVHCEDGEAAAHRLSSGHSGYSKEETDIKFGQKLGIKPASCATICSTGAKQCAQCPHFQEGKNPTYFAKIDQPNGVAVNPNDILPYGYKRAPNDYILQLGVDSEGNPVEVPVLEYPITSPWKSEGPEGTHLHFTTTINKKQRSLAVSLRDHMPSRDTFRKFLWEKSIEVKDVDANRMRDFTVAWLKALRMSGLDTIDAVPMGWRYKDGDPVGFTFANTTFTDKGNTPAMVSGDLVTADQFRVAGKPEPWQAMSKLITDQDRPDMDAYFASTAFGSPLIKLTGHHGLVLAVHQLQTGAGKTTVSETAVAAWGNSKTAKGALDDTAKSLSNKMGQIRNICLHVDELQQPEQLKKHAGMIFQQTGGKEMSRLTSNIQQRLSGDYDLLLASMSNESIYDYVARNAKTTDAGIVRLVDYELAMPHKASTYSTAEVTAMTAKLNSNYGHAGYAYAEFLGKNIARVQKDMMDMSLLVERVTSNDPDERFWRAWIAITRLGARYSNELGLTKFHIGNLDIFTIELWQKLRARKGMSTTNLSRAVNVSSILTDFLNDKAISNTVYTDKIHTGGTRPVMGAIKRMGDPAHWGRLSALHVHIGSTDRLCRVKIQAISEWLMTKGYNPTTITGEIQNQFGATIGSRGLGAGVSGISSGQMRVLEFKLDHPALAQYTQDIGV